MIEFIYVFIISIYIYFFLKQETCWSSVSFWAINLPKSAVYVLRWKSGNHRQTPVWILKSKKNKAKNHWRQREKFYSNCWMGRICDSFKAGLIPTRRFTPLLSWYVRAVRTVQAACSSRLIYPALEAMRSKRTESLDQRRCLFGVGPLNLPM